MTTTPPPAVNTDTQALYDSLGPLTAGDAALGYPLLRWLDGVGSILQPLDDLVRDTPLGPGCSQLMDPNRCPPQYLPWLGQFVGVTVDTSLSVTAQRQQIAAEAGFQRGTLASITAVAQRFLKPGGIVHIYERDGGPYNLTVTVFKAQMVGMDYADLDATYGTYAQLSAQYPTYAQFAYSSDELRLALLAAKPAGIVLNLNVQSGASYQDLTGQYATYSALSAAFSTYTAMTNSVPNP